MVIYQLLEGICATSDGTRGIFARMTNQPYTGDPTMTPLSSHQKVMQLIGVIKMWRIVIMMVKQWFGEVPLRCQIVMVVCDKYE